MALRNGTLLWLAIYPVTSQTLLGLRLGGPTVLLLASLPAVIVILSLLSSLAVQVRWLLSSEHPRYRELAPHLAPLVILDYYLWRPGRERPS